jgi:hypothetical protein
VGSFGFSFEELRQEQFDAMKWLVPGFIPEGLTILAGKPKVGKSFFVLSVAIAIATGGAVLDEVCEQGDVFYFALEDGKRRLHERTGKITGHAPEWPSNLYGHLELPPIGEGGIRRLQQCVDTHPNLRVIIIDTLARVRGKRLDKEDQAGTDARFMGELLAFTHRNKVSIILVHHLRKQASDDPQDMVSGTNQITAAADSILTLNRVGSSMIDNNRRLIVWGRDIEPRDVNIVMDRDTSIWSCTGDWEEPKSEATTKILTTLRDAKYPQKPEQIAKTTGLSPATVRGTLRRMLNEGLVKQPYTGCYEV